MVKIEKVIYSNESGELVTVDFSATDVEYTVDRVSDLVREMASGGRDLGPAPPPPPESGAKKMLKAGWSWGWA